MHTVVYIEMVVFEVGLHTILFHVLIVLFSPISILNKLNQEQSAYLWQKYIFGIVYWILDGVLHF